MSGFQRALVDCAKAVPMEHELERRGIKLGGRHKHLSGPCPRCGGTDRFFVNTAKGYFGCRSCRPRGGDVIDLVMHIDGCTFTEAVEALTSEDHRRGNLRWSSKTVPNSRAAPSNNHDTFNLADRIWGVATALTPPAFTYFEKRGISLDDLPEQSGLRFDSHCPWEGGTRPCVIARYTDAVTEETRSIWRRPITGEKPRALGPTAGCVIRLWPDEEVTQGLMLGEGVETTLAAATRIEHRGTLLRPAWAAGSSGNMAAFPVLAGIEALTLLVDNDHSGAGQRAAEKCKARWESASREVTLLIPKTPGADFNDVVLR